MKLDPVIERAARAAFSDTFRFFDAEDGDPLNFADDFIRSLTREIEIEKRNADRKADSAREAQ